MLLLGSDKIASLYPAIYLLLDVVDARLPKRSLQRVTQNRPFFDYRFALQIAIARKGYGPPCHIILLTLVLHVLHGPVLGRFNDPRRLVPETLGDLLVAMLHLLMRHVELGFSGLVRGDLRRRGALSIRFGQVALDLLATQAGRVEVLARLASDLGLTATTALDLVTEGGQSRCQLGSIDRRGVLLRPVQLARLQWTHCTVGRLGEVEDNRVGMELRRRVAVHRPGAVVLKKGRYRIAGRFRPAITTEPRLRGNRRSCAAPGTGATWHLFGNGMPLVIVSDLYMPADGSFLRAATYG